jgi:hypothetical protein
MGHFSRSDNPELAHTIKTDLIQNNNYFAEIKRSGSFKTFNFELNV